MINPGNTANRDRHQTALYSTLISVIGDVGAIQAFDDELNIQGTPDLAFNDMMGYGIVVTWIGADSPRSGETRGYTHNFSLMLHAPTHSDYFTLAQAVVDGIPAGDWQAFQSCEVHADCDGVQSVSILPDHRLR